MLSSLYTPYTKKLTHPNGQLNVMKSFHFRGARSKRKEAQRKTVYFAVR